jgi:cytidylate kinase
VAELARTLAIEVDEHVTVDGQDATAGIRTAAVDAAVSAVAANPDVRREMVTRQRAWVAARGGGVVEGRDIGTVVLPHADLKVYLTAQPDERARRRTVERGGDPAHMAEVAAGLDRRDTLDSTRQASPLPSAAEVPPDAVIVDSTGKPADEVLQEVLTCL